MSDPVFFLDAPGSGAAEQDYLELHRAVADGRYDTVAHGLAAGVFGPDRADALRRVGEDSPDRLFRAFLNIRPNADALYDIMASRTVASMALMEPDNPLRWAAPRMVAWGWSRIGLGAVRLLDRTGDERFAGLLKAACRYLLDCRNGSLRDPEVKGRATAVSPHGWISPVSGDRKECEYTTEITTTGLLLRPFLQFFRVRPPSGADEERLYRDVLRAGEELYAFHGRAALRQGDHVQYLMPDGRPEALNHVSAYLAFLIELNRHVRRDDMTAHVADAGRVFFASLVRTPLGGLAWPYLAGMEDAREFAAREGVPGEDTPHWLHSERYWKSNVTALLPLEMINGGYPVAADLKDRMVDTFLHQLMPGEYVDEGRICGRVFFPEGRCFTTPAKVGEMRYSNIAGWAEWAPLCPEILDRITAAVEHRPDIFWDGWLTSYCSLLALTYKDAC